VVARVASTCLKVEAQIVFTLQGYCAQRYMYCFARLGLGPGNLSQNGQKPTPFTMTPIKKTKPKTKNFFSVRTRRPAKSFEGLDSSLAQSASKLWSCIKWYEISGSMHDFKVRIYLYTDSQLVKNPKKTF